MDSIKEKFSFYGNIKGSNTRIKPWDLWKRVIIDKIRGDDSSYPLIRNYNFYTNGSAIMSGKNKISYIYTIDGYPASVPIDYRERIRLLARGAKVAFISTFEPTVIDWNGAQMKSKLKTWKTMDEDADEVTSYNYVENVDSMDSIERRKASLIYLADADKRRSRSLFKYRTLMIIAGVRGESFDKAIYEINDYCKSTGIKITRVESQVSEYLKAFSPFTMELGNNILKQVGSNTLTDEEIARFSSYTQGKIGIRGVIFGTDIFSGYNVYKILKKKDTDAENILITAETGGGKSYLLKSILAQIDALPEYTGTINDIEGFEYIPFGNFCANQR